jgi:hypothetical protein
MIIALCIADAHDHARFAAYVQPPAMKRRRWVVTGYEKKG